MKFKPSEVLLTTPCPLTACFGRTECEQAGFMIVRALAVKGDTWRAISNADVFAVFKADVGEKRNPARALAGNPFFRPDVFGLVKRGYLVTTGENGPAMTVEFTDKAIDSIAKWAPGGKYGPATPKEPR